MGGIVSLVTEDRLVPVVNVISLCLLRNLEGCEGGR